MEVSIQKKSFRMKYLTLTTLNWELFGGGGGAGKGYLGAWEKKLQFASQTIGFDHFQ